MTAMHRVLVCGATGRQGGAVSRALLAHGFEVLALTRSPQTAAAYELERLGAQVVAGDLNQPVSLHPIMQGVGAVIHCASPFPIAQPDDPQQLIRPAVDGTRRVLGAAASGAGPASAQPDSPAARARIAIRAAARIAPTPPPAGPWPARPPGPTVPP